MQVIHERCAGLDVHKETVVACMRVCERGEAKREVSRAFGARGLAAGGGLQARRDVSDRCLLEACVARAAAKSNMQPSPLPVATSTALSLRTRFSVATTEIVGLNPSRPIITESHWAPLLGQHPRPSRIER
jgi:hypothetical protein